MGIKDMTKYLTDNTETAMRSFKLTACKGWKVSVDTSIVVHKIVTATRSGGNETTNENGEITSHLTGLFNKTLGFLQNGIIPIFVFDGKSPDLKKATVADRVKARTEAEQKLASLDPTSEEYLKCHSRAYRSTPQQYDEARILLSLMGIPWINAPGEADVVCSWLASRRTEDGDRYVMGVASEDSDMLPFGAPYLCKNMIDAVTKHQEFTLVSLRRILSQLEIDMEQFVDTCVLLGTDHNNRIKGVGPAAIRKLMIKYGSLDKIIEHYNKDSKKTADPDYYANIECMKQAKNYFMTALSDLDDSGFKPTETQLSMCKCQRDNLIDFLVNKHGFDPSDIVYKVTRLLEYQTDVELENEYEYISTGKTNEALEYVDCEYVFE